MPEITPYSAVQAQQDTGALEHYPVMEEYGNLSQNIEVLSDEIRSLADKLYPVLTPERLKGQDEGHTSIPCATGSPLMESLRGDNDRLLALIHKVRNLRMRIEVGTRFEAPWSPR